MILDDIDPCNFTAGVQTIRCECGWEVVFILPEDCVTMPEVIVMHLYKHQGGVFPVLTCFMH